MTTLSAPAKLTWFLEVTGRRPDGYHLLRSEMVSLDLADSLEIADAASTSISIAGTARGAENVPRDETNLVARALRALGRSAHVAITKNVPSGAGLGGGSSDAAAILRWAHCDDVAVAARLGADVPFCVRGGRAVVEGIGEQVTALEFVEREVTLILAPFGVDTAACFAAYDEAHGAARDASARNHLFDAAVMVEPRLGQLAQFLRRETGREPVLAGSGSTMFFEGAVSGLEHDTNWESPLGVLQVRRARTTPAYVD